MPDGVVTAPLDVGARLLVTLIDLVTLDAGVTDEAGAEVSVVAPREPEAVVEAAMVPFVEESEGVEEGAGVEEAEAPEEKEGLEMPNWTESVRRGGIG